MKVYKYYSHHCSYNIHAVEKLTTNKMHLFSFRDPQTPQRDTTAIAAPPAIAMYAAMWYNSSPRIADS